VSTADGEQMLDAAAGWAAGCAGAARPYRSTADGIALCQVAVALTRPDP